MTEGDLEQVLGEARRLGFLGPGPVEDHVEHTLGMALVVEGELAGATPGSEGAPRCFCDLGSGGGVPGLVLARCWPGAEGVLLESSGRRCRALEDWLRKLGFDHRIQVLEGRAESLARLPRWREMFPVVVARAFGRPAVTAESAAGLLAPAGLLVVAEAPEPDPRRWPEPGLAGLGLGPAQPREALDRRFVVIRKTAPVPGRFPRRVGIPAKRPLW